jgi:creatinine amidohydrolase
MKRTILSSLIITILAAGPALLGGLDGSGALPDGQAGRTPGRGPVPACPLDARTSIFHETMVDLPWTEVEKSARDGAVVLMAAAVIEEHGPHLTCGTDTYLGYLMGKLIRRELESRGVRAVIAPPFFWGVNSATHVFPGSFSVRPETAKALLEDIFASLTTMGFRRVFIINAHGDGQHKRMLIQSILAARPATGLNIRLLFAEEDAKAAGLTGPPPDWVLLHKMPAWPKAEGPSMDIHAGAFETAAMAAFFPDQVNLPLAKKLEPTRLTRQQAGDWLKDARKTTPLGYFGDPAGYDTEAARTFFQDWCRMMSAAIADYAATAR